MKKIVVWSFMVAVNFCNGAMPQPITSGLRLKIERLEMQHKIFLHICEQKNQQRLRSKL